MTTTRREFLKVVGAGGCAMSVGGVAACGPPPGPVAAGNVSELAVGDVKQIEGATLLVGRDDGGVYAMTAFCTHANCDLAGPSGSVAEDGTISCSCHGSKFNPDGSVLQGPAASPLQHFKVDVADDGAITVDTTAEVDATDRTAVAAG